MRTHEGRLVNLTHAIQIYLDVQADSDKAIGKAMVVAELPTQEVWLYYGGRVDAVALLEVLATKLEALTTL